MPSITYINEEFSLFTTADGADTGLVAAALDVAFDRSGNWRVDSTGLITGWHDGTNRSHERVLSTPKVAWLPAGDLDRLIMARAHERYRNEIDELVFAACDDAYGPLPDPNAEHALSYATAGA